MFVKAKGNQLPTLSISTNSVQIELVFTLDQWKRASIICLRVFTQCSVWGRVNSIWNAEAGILKIEKAEESCRGRYGERERYTLYMERNCLITTAAVILLSSWRNCERGVSLILSRVMSGRHYHKCCSFWPKGSHVVTLMTLREIWKERNWNENASIHNVQYKRYFFSLSFLNLSSDQTKP